ncbi:anhydro-N-acetylmuramic acid kinase [Myroides marinus]|uniref:anhydro-N-acetylmuramic acid kinase n=1 Tax=Myroides marinus TaxID=703342 RepID=UPI0025749A33|nr:anhydro-N-acetylmuramic acid kinase [Myroides marinus]MDM1390803.1 anhydro-N-acetylmuramic acid kinase [Myroides marinus]
MKKYQYNIIGVMSGTSLDGIDLAYVTFYCEGDKWSFEVHCTDTVSYNAQWKEQLKNAIKLDSKQIEVLDERYTVHLATVINQFIKDNGLDNIDAVCSHGHTIFHKPELGYTLQIGNMSVLADLLHRKVVCDFRVQDVLLGGQGAPLVPIGDRLLFSDYAACLNLGGFANVSFENKLGYRLAYDICPVNTLLNEQVSKLGLEYDDKGALAAKGQVNAELLAELNALDFYTLSAPKSLGVEFVNTYVQPILTKYTLSEEDFLATLVEHIAIQIAQGIGVEGRQQVLVTGGGAKNDYLIERIKGHAPSIVFDRPIDVIIDFKEAIVFGLLGVLKLRDDVNVLASVTGAKYDHSSGKVYDYFAKNY